MRKKKSLHLPPKGTTMGTSSDRKMRTSPLSVELHNPNRPRTNLESQGYQRKKKQLDNCRKNAGSSYCWKARSKGHQKPWNHGTTVNKHHPKWPLEGNIDFAPGNKLRQLRRYVGLFSGLPKIIWIKLNNCKLSTSTSTVTKFIFLLCLRLFHIISMCSILFYIPTNSR